MQTPSHLLLTEFLADREENRSALPLVWWAYQRALRWGLAPFWPAVVAQQTGG